MAVTPFGVTITARAGFSNSKPNFTALGEPLCFNRVFLDDSSVFLETTMAAVDYFLSVKAQSSDESKSRYILRTENL